MNDYKQKFLKRESFLEKAEVVLDLNVSHYNTNICFNIPDYNIRIFSRFKNENYNTRIMPARRIIGFKNPDILLVMQTEIGEHVNHPRIEIATPEQYIQTYNEIIGDIDKNLKNQLEIASEIKKIIESKEREILSKIISAYELNC